MRGLRRREKEGGAKSASGEDTGTGKTVAKVRGSHVKSKQD
jgi:hypothetical protein